MHVCKRIRTARSSIRIDWDHMLSEASSAETAIGTVPVRVFDVCATNFIHPMNYV